VLVLGVTISSTNSAGVALFMWLLGGCAHCSANERPHLFGGRANLSRAA
jgi:hypothetical protein